MSVLLPQIEAESSKALAAFYDTDVSCNAIGHCFSSIELCFSYGQRIWISCLDLPKRPQQITLKGRYLDALTQLEKTWKENLKLVSIEFTNTSSCGLFGNEQRDDVFIYTIATQQTRQETFYK